MDDVTGDGEVSFSTWVTVVDLGLTAGLRRLGTVRQPTDADLLESGAAGRDLGVCGARHHLSQRPRVDGARLGIPAVVIVDADQPVFREEGEPQPVVAASLIRRKCRVKRGPVGYGVGPCGLAVA